MYSLPTVITVNDTDFHITNNGDYRMVLDCFGALNDKELGEDFRVLASLIIFYEEFNDILDVQEYDSDTITELVKEMFLFFNCGREEKTMKHTNTPLINWVSDEQIISAAINNVANAEIRSIEYLHWWTFMGYYMSIGESVLSTVVSIRNKIVHGKKLEKWEKEYRRDNPEYFEWRNGAAEDKEIDDFIKSLTRGGENDAE